MVCAQITRIEWGRELDSGLSAAQGDKHDGAAIAADVRDGYAQGWRIETDAGACYLVIRIDSIGGRRECVIVAAQGRGLASVLDMIYSAAQQAGCHRIRFHTQRTGLARLIARKYDVEHIEHVYAVEIGAQHNG